jgi:hypothetical protein
MQLCISQDHCWVEPGFPEHVGQEERAELVGDFAAVATTVVATVNMEDFLRDGGQGS